MSIRYRYACTLSWGGDEPTAELEVECSYGVTWGRPARGPSYASGGEPADPDEVEDITILTVDGKAWPTDISYGHMTDAESADMLVEKLLCDHYDDMIAEAVETEAARQDDAADRRYPNPQDQLSGEEEA